MIVLGIILIVVAIAGIIWGSVNMASKSYSVPFAAHDTVDAVCNDHIKPLGTAPGTSCGLLVKNSKGQSVSCRKGTVNPVGNECIADADHLGPGLLAGSVLVMVAGIVCCCVKDEQNHGRRHHHAKHTK